MLHESFFWDGLAPTQIYIVLALTVTTFSWLLSPRVVRVLEAQTVAWCATLVLVQIGHIAVYAYGASLTGLLHLLVLGAYLGVSGRLFLGYWAREAGIAEGEATPRLPGSSDDNGTTCPL